MREGAGRTSKKVEETRWSLRGRGYLLGGVILWYFLGSLLGEVIITCFSIFILFTNYILLYLTVANRWGTPLRGARDKAED